MEADVGKLEAQLKVWGARIDRLAAAAGKAGVGARIELHQQIDDLKAKRAIAQARFDEFRAAGIATQARLETGLERAWDEIETAFTDLKR